MRLFVAIDIGSAARATLAAAIERLARGGDPVKWVPRENLHLTVKFIGEARDDLLSEIEAACARAAAASAPFTMRIKGTGAFPNARRPRVFWAGVEAPRALHELVDAVERELEPLGFEREKRPYEAHVTLGRAREGHQRRRPRAGRAPALEAGAGVAEALAKEAELDAGEVRVERIRLMRSQLRREGPIYTPVREIPLGSLDD